MFKNLLKLDQMAPPECDDFFDHLQITSILAHMISCANNARFPRFYIFLNFFEFIMPSRLTVENIGLCLKGHCKIIFFKNFFHRHVWHMCVTMYRKIGVIWRWWKNSPFFKNWLKLDQMVPQECGHFFDHLQITSILAHMISCTNNARFPRFCIFLNFLNL